MGGDLEAVLEFWNEAACGEVYAEGDTLAEQLAAHAEARYRLEPYIIPFARFEECRDRDVLEIGVGMGADHAGFSDNHPRRLVGLDLTARAIDWTSKRLQLAGANSDLMVASAEALPFPSDTFDLVYAWGVLHHTPETHQAFDEVHRVLRPGGVARIMIYHRPSIIGYTLWLRYGLLSGKPWTPLKDIYANHMESPGTKGYTLAEARELVSAFASNEIRAQLSFGDLLRGEVGQRHHGILLALAKKVWPRRAIARLFPYLGSMLMIEASK